MKKLEKRKGMKAVRFRECLAGLSVSGNDSSFYLYTLEWFNAINRGKLYHVHDNAFLFFRAVEVKTQQLLPGRLEPNLPLILPILLFDNAQNFYLFCLKLCQCLPIFPENMPVHVHLFCS